MPSRKIISILILASALVTGIILASSKKMTGSGTGQIVALKTPAVKISTQDTGEWKRDLYTLPASSTIEESISKPKTLTDEVSQSLVANYLAMKQSGTLDNTSVQKLIDQASQTALLPAAPRYTSASLTISQDNGKNAVRTYGTDLGNVFKSNKPTVLQDELMVFQTMVQNKDSAEAPKLREVAKVYRSLSVTLSKTTVPSSYVSSHLQLVNGLDQIAGALDNMSLFFEDPIKSLQAIYHYQNALIDIDDSSNEIKKNILKDGVIYKQGESGYYFYFGI